ncbi:hypothetical protein GSH05_29715 [Burkholderia pseudomallei]|nr:hypothetical protein [Burkholderia pseudomallei]
MDDQVRHVRMQVGVMTRKVDIMPPIARISQIRRAARGQAGRYGRREGDDDTGDKVAIRWR